jgi:hypothetical protein
MNMARLSVLRTGRLYSQEIAQALSSVRGWVDRRDIVRPEGFLSLKTSNENNGSRTRDLSSCSTVPQQTVPPRVPLSKDVNNRKWPDDIKSKISGVLQMCCSGSFRKRMRCFRMDADGYTMSIQILLTE